MSFFSRMQEKHRGIETKGSSYFEMSYTRDKKTFYICFMAIDLNQAKLKAQLLKKRLKAKKVIYLKQLNSQSLASSLKWNNKDWNK